MHPYNVNGLLLPPLLIDLLRNSLWRHPGDATLERLIPFLRDPVDFLQTVEGMRFESPKRLADDAEWARMYHFLQSSGGASDLPWLDVDRAVFIAVNRFPGDDSGIVLDYRTDAADPRVVASDWDDGPGGCRWRQVTPTFSTFVALLEA